MKNKSSYSPVESTASISGALSSALLCALLCTLAVPPSRCSGRRARMDACRGRAPLPPQTKKQYAVLLSYSEQIVNVQSADRIKTRVRHVFKILRPGGRDYGIGRRPLYAHRKIKRASRLVYSSRKGKTMR